MPKQIIALSGGPGTGKSTVIAKLKSLGYCCYDEISRDVLLEAKKKGVENFFLENPLEFSKMILDERVLQFENAHKEGHEVVFIDRGIPDVLAYLNFIDCAYPKDFESICHQHTYNKVFIFPPWEHIYVKDELRQESFEEAELIYKNIRKTYITIGYQSIEIPIDTVDNRILFILANLADSR